MNAYVLTFMLVIGSVTPTQVTINSLRSVEQCHEIARLWLASLPRNIRMVDVSCRLDGHFT